jgi:branched-chain amino acid transport system ATP-binding protein
MGLAPLVVAEIFRLIGVLKNELHMSILIVEQNARAALRLCDRAHVLSLGQSIIEGTGADLMNDPAVQQAFLGGGQV